VNARAVNNIHFAFLIAYLGVTCAVADSIAAWPARIGARTSAAHGAIETVLARYPLIVWLGLPSAVLVLHVVTRVGQRVAPQWWLLARDERHLLDLTTSEAAPITEDRRRLFAWIGWFATTATVSTSCLMYGLGSLAVTGNPESLRFIPLLVAPSLGMSLVAFVFAVRYGVRARTRIQQIREAKVVRSDNTAVTK